MDSDEKLVELTFGHVEAILAEWHHIADHKRVAFTSRLKALQKLGVPSGARPGRGKTSSYSFGQFLQFAIGLELLQAGLTPSTASRIVITNWSRIRNSLVWASRDVGPKTNIVWVIRMKELHELSIFGTSDLDYIGKVEVWPANQVSETLTSVTNAFFIRHPVLIVPTSLYIEYFCIALEEQGFIERGDPWKEMVSENAQYIQTWSEPGGKYIGETCITPWGNEAHDFFLREFGDELIEARVSELIGRHRQTIQSLKFAEEKGQIGMRIARGGTFSNRARYWDLVRLDESSNEVTNWVISPLGRAAIRQLGQVKSVLEDGDVNPEA